MQRVELSPGDAGIPALSDELMAKGSWDYVGAGTWLHIEAIHVLEGRAMLAGLRRASRVVSQHGLRLLSVGDNLLRKGPSIR